MYKLYILVVAFFQVKMSDLVERIKLEQNQFEQTRAEIEREQHNRQTRAAVIIQTAFRGHRCLLDPTNIFQCNLFSSRIAKDTVKHCGVVLFDYFLLRLLNNMLFKSLNTWWMLLPSYHLLYDCGRVCHHIILVLLFTMSVLYHRRHIEIKDH